MHTPRHAFNSKIITSRNVKEMLQWSMNYAIAHFFSVLFLPKLGVIYLNVILFQILWGIHLPRISIHLGFLGFVFHKFMGSIRGYCRKGN